MTAIRMLGTSAVAEKHPRILDTAERLMKAAGQGTALGKGHRPTNARILKEYTLAQRVE